MIKPDYLEARLNLAGSFSAAGEFSAAEKALHELLAIAPTYIPALVNLSTVQLEIGQHTAAVETMRQVISIAPENVDARSNLLMGLQYMPGVTTAELTRHATDWGRWAVERVR